jgi:hypothetical protein
VELVRKTLIACVVTALAVGVGTASADSLITGKDIRDGSIHKRDLSPNVRALLAKAGKPGVNGTNGKDGVNGAKGDAGANGTNGAKGDAGADALNVVRVNSLSDDANVAAPGWAAHGGATLADDHVKFGPFADGDAFAGVRFHGLDGLKLDKLESLSYEQRVTVGDKMAAPYFRIFTTDAAGAEHAVIYSPSTQAGDDQATGEWRTEKIMHGGVRYDDDAGNEADITWADMIDAHGDDVITQVQIQAGNAGSYSNGTTSHVDNVRVAIKGQSSIPDTLYTFGK